MAGFVRELVLFGRPGLALTAISRALAGRMRNVLPGFHGEPEAQEIHEDHTQSLEWAPAIDGAGPAFDVNTVVVHPLLTSGNFMLESHHCR